jgi:carbon-monoxide dehydrogenase small subunit
VQTLPITITVNSEEYTAEVEPRLLLVHFIRENLGLTGTHIGCDTTSCGDCTILYDGKPIKSCTMFAVQADGHALETVEGLANGPTLHPIQEGFFQEHGLQCGFCTPGMMMVASVLLEKNPDPTDLDIREAISGNLCRCTGYVNVVAAIRTAAAIAHGRTGSDTPPERA